MKTEKSHVLSISVSVEKKLWERWCKNAEKYGFTGEEYTELSILSDVDDFKDKNLEYGLMDFHDIRNPPEWAKKRLLEGLLKECNCEKGDGRYEYFKRKFTLKRKAA